MAHNRVIESQHPRQTRKTWSPLHTLVLILGALSGNVGASAETIPAAPQKISRSFLTVESAGQSFRLSYLHAGDPNGQRVIFVHGTPGSAEGWNDYLHNVPDGFEYIAIDRPGFGESGPDHAVPSLERLAHALSGLLVARDGRHPVLVGHSLGGPVVARAAVDYPDQVAGIMIAAGSLDPDLEEIHPLQHLGEIWPIKLLLPRSIRNANQELFALEAELDRLLPRLKEISIPVKIIHGTNDDLVPFENVAFMETHLSNAHLDITVLSDRNHFLPWHSKLEMDNALARLIAILERK